MTKKLYLFPIIFILTAAAVGVYFFYFRTGVHQTFSINLTENTFSPQQITIQKGDTVIFTTSRGIPFWPASDPHPTHDNYPGFDPKRPIPANEGWPFQFDRVGTWGFHDHLDPYYRGTVQVTD